MYCFYIAYNRKIESKENELLLCFALFTSMYLIIFKGAIHYPRTAFILANVPIILAFAKKKTKEAIFLIIMYMMAAVYLFNVYYMCIIIEYAIYFIIYLYSKREKFNQYLFASFIFLTKTFLFILGSGKSSYFFDKNIFDDILCISIPLTYITTLLVLYIVDLGNDIVKYHISYKELVREKQIRTSLFKITHEIKNPLAVCKGYLDMLDVNNGEQCKKYIPIIKDEINHTLLILKDFSSFSKVSVEKDIMDMNYLLDEVVSNLSELLKKNNIKIIFSSKDEVYISADYTRLMQVFINIIKNSIESFEDKKKKKITITEREDTNNIYITIEDNGMGIKKEDLIHISKPFFTTKKTGTGLGVSLSNEIILAHGGTMKYESEYGIGTKVIIKLPKK
jgi:signal transduction histidine kinase